MKNFNSNEFVIFEVHEVIQNIEPWVQYETFGEDLHNIIVSRKPILVTKQEDGSFKTKEGKSINVNDKNDKLMSSYRTTSNSTSSIVGSGMVTGGDLKKIGVDKKNLVTLNGSLGMHITHYGFPMQAQKYYEEMSVMDKVKNSLGKQKHILLSEDKIKATKQLKEIGIEVNEPELEEQSQPQ